MPSSQKSKQPKPIRYDGGWKVATWRGGRRVRKRFPDSRGGRQAAYNEAVRFLEELERPPEPVSPDLRSTVHEYVRWSEHDKRKSAAWVATSNQMILDFVAHLEKSHVRSVHRIQIDHLRTYRTAFAKNAKRSDATWEKYRQSISAWLNWCRKRDLHVTNHAADPEFRVRVQSKAPDTFERSEVEAILAFMDNQDGAGPPYRGLGFRLLFYTGMRRGELWGLKWEDVSIPGQYLTAGTKSKHERPIPLSVELIPFFARMPRDTVHVFDDGTGEPIFHKKHWYMLLQMACAALKIRLRPLHATRHTFVRFLYEAGADDKTVRDLCGHLTASTTLLYAKFFNTDRSREMIGRLKY